MRVIFPWIVRPSLVLRMLVLIFILFASFGTSQIQPKKGNQFRSLRRVMRGRLPLIPESMTVVNHSNIAPSISASSAISLNNSKKIITDVYSGIIDGITDEVSKAVVDNVYLGSHGVISDYHSIVRVFLAGILSQVAKSSATVAQEIASKEQVLSRNDAFLNQSEPFVNALKPETTQIDERKGNVDDSEEPLRLKQQVKTVSIFVTRWILMPAIAHSLAYHLPEFSVHEGIEWIKEHTFNTFK